MEDNITYDVDYYRKHKDYIVENINGKPCVFHKDDVNVANKRLRIYQRTKW